MTPPSWPSWKSFSALCAMRPATRKNARSSSPNWISSSKSCCPIWYVIEKYSISICFLEGPAHRLQGHSLVLQQEDRGFPPHWTLVRQAIRQQGWRRRKFLSLRLVDREIFRTTWSARNASSLHTSCKKLLTSTKLKLMSAVSWARMSANTWALTKDHGND